jgi:hypothetical protein
MKSGRIYCLFLVSLGLTLSPLLVSRSGAHTALAVNGAVSLTIRRSNTVVEYQIECGALTPVDVRRKIDRNGNGTISKGELEAFNKAAQRKLAKTKSLCHILVDAKPVKLLPEKVAFILPANAPDGTAFMKLSLASKQSLSPGPHQLVLTGNFCTLDTELLGLPAASPGHRHGALVRILKVIAAGEHSVQFSKVSSGFISGEDQKKVRSLLNNLVKQVQIDFELAEAETDQVQCCARPAAKGLVTSLDAITMPTPGALKAPVKITEISTFDALTFDPKAKKSGTISYKLSKRAWVRIRILLRSDEQLVLRTLVDWSERKAGKNVETWDGRDAAGHLVDKARFPCFIAIDADSQIHRKHPRAMCKDLRLSLKLKDSLPEPASGKVGVQVALDDDTRGYGQQFGYKVRAYADFKLLRSFTYKPKAGRGFDLALDTTGLSTGEHLLTIVVDDGADHVGSTSLKFNVLN